MTAAATVATPLSNQSAVTATATVGVPTQGPDIIAYAPFFTGLAAIIASLIAGTVAILSIRASRKNLLEQLKVQRDLADKAQNLQRELSARASWANVVSTNRQKWVDALREDLAEFISADYVLVNDLSNGDNSITALENNKRNEIVAEATIKRRTYYRRIQLRLNPNKPAHEELWQEIKAVSSGTDKEHSAAMRRLITKAQKLLRGEWVRVKYEASGATAPLSSEFGTPSS